MSNELKQYLDRANTLAKLFGDKEYDLNNVFDRRRLAEKLDCDLSPENLSCDGEVRGKALKHKYTFLTRVLKQLVAIEEHERKHYMLAGGPFPISY
jgi:hypothetical protein